MVAPVALFAAKNLAKKALTNEKLQTFVKDTVKDTITNKIENFDGSTITGNPMNISSSAASIKDTAVKELSNILPKIPSSLPPIPAAIPKLNLPGLSSDNIVIDIASIIKANPGKFILVCIVFFLYIKYFYEKQTRLFNSAIMIKLEPENIDYTSTMGKFFFYYFYCKNFKVDCNDQGILDNLYFYESTTISNIMEQIDQNVLKNVLFSNEFFNKDFQAEYQNIANDDDRDTFQENYIESIQKLFNTNFRWSKMDKYKITEENKEIFDSLFNKESGYLKNLCDKNGSNNVQENIDIHMNNSSLFNYIDIDNLMKNDIHEMLSNKTIKKYGYYLNDPLFNIIRQVNTELESKYPDTYRENKTILSNILHDIDDNDAMTKVNEPPLKELFKYIFEQFKTVIFEYYDINDLTFMKLKLKYDTDKNVFDYNDLKACKQDDIKNFEFKNKKEEDLFNELLRLLMFVESLEERFTEENYDNFLGEYYFIIEKAVYMLFDPKTHEPIFSEAIAKNILFTYQNILDFVYLKQHPDLIRQSVYFSIYYLLTPGEEKENRLENLIMMNMLVSEMFLKNKHYLDRIIDYNNKRNPDMNILKKLYKMYLENIVKIHWKQNVKDQWGQYFGFERPTKVFWIIQPLIEYLQNTSISDILKIVEPFEQHETDYKEPFVEAEKIDKEIVVEGFLGGFGKLIKAFAKLPEFLMSFIKVLTNILNPFKLIELIAKFVIALGLISLKILYFSFKIGKVYPGEFIITLPFIVVYSIVNIIILIWSYVLTYIAKWFDTEITNGLIYRFMYWMFGAEENSPSSWYKRSGHHYGFDTCKQLDDDSTKCNNVFQNKVSRQFFAFYPCGNNYKPDRELNGFMCARKYMQEPSFCLQSNIYRLNNNMKVDTPIVPGDFYPTIEFTKSMKGNRRKMTNQFKKMKKNFHNNCFAAMRKYDSTTKNVCRLYAGLNGMGSNTKMDTLCHNAYCTNGTHNQMCNKLTESYIASNNDNPGIVSKMFVLFIYIIVVSFALSKMTSIRHNFAVQ